MAGICFFGDNVGSDLSEKISDPVVHFVTVTNLTLMLILDVGKIGLIFRFESKKSSR